MFVCIFYFLHVISYSLFRIILGGHSPGNHDQEKVREKVRKKGNYFANVLENVDIA